jgi:hypothetical protein
MTRLSLRQPYVITIEKENQAEYTVEAAGEKRN